MSEKLINMTDKDNTKCVNIIEYQHYNKLTKKIDILKMYFIMNKNMIKEIKNKDIFQFLGDATYRCLPQLLELINYISYLVLI